MESSILGKLDNCIIIKEEKLNVNFYLATPNSMIFDYSYSVMEQYRYTLKGKTKNCKVRYRFTESLPSVF